MKILPRALIPLLCVSFISTQLFAQWIKTTAPEGGEIMCLISTPVVGSVATIFAGTNFTGVLRSTDSGTTWNPAGLPTALIFALGSIPRTAGGSYLFAGTYNYGPLVSTDNGATWSSVTAGMANTTVESFAFSPHPPSGTNVFAGTQAGGIILSSDFGVTWQPAGLAGRNIRTLAATSGNLFAGNFGIFRSTDDGANWGLITNGLGDTTVYCVTVSGGTLFAGTRTGAYRSTNDGTLWSSAGLAGYGVYALAFSGGNMFAGTITTGEVFFSTDNGANWTAASVGLPLRSIFSLTVANGYLFAGTSQGGIWRRPISEMVTAVEPAVRMAPSEVSLVKIYPNPFNPSTMIRYSIPERAFVTVSIYDVLGRQISVLVNGESEIGSKEIRFDGTGLASGVYLVRLTAGKSTVSQKIVLAK